MSYQELFIKKCMEALKSDGEAIKYVPEELLTPEMCLEAVKRNEEAIRYVPEELKNSRNVFGSCKA